MTQKPFQARLFIAVPVPPQYRPILKSWSDLLQTKWSFKRWLHPNDYHITLKFIGECDFPQTLKIKEHLKTIAASNSSMSLSIEGLGTFDNNVSTKILWAGVQGELNRLEQLHKQIDTALEKLGFVKEKNTYKPHITLARNYLGGIIDKSEMLKAPTVKDNILNWNANEIVLYQTHIGQSPAYQPLAIYPLQG